MYKKPVKMSINNDYTTGNLSDYLHDQKYYKHIGIIYHDKNVTGKLDKDDEATMFSITEKQQKTILNFFLDSLIMAE